MLKLLISFMIAVVLNSSARAGELQSAASCLVGTGAGHLRCRPFSLPPKSDANLNRAGVPLGFHGVFSFYRLVSRGVEHRRCRLQPTCSLFAAKATNQFGLWRGALMGLARAQMEHSDQGGFLKREIGNDGFFIYHDPLSYWEHDHK